MVSEALQALEVGGRLSSLIDGFSPRVEQQAMARAVEHAIEGREVLICEAGTGTGKTLAYLCAVLGADCRAIISTGTKNLQEQLYRKDLPLALDALRINARVALLKGRANYLCQHRMDITANQPSIDLEEQAELAQIVEWTTWTQTGDIGECSDIPENAAIWQKVTSTVENCLGVECRFYEKCHVLHARRRATEAHVVVVNHHLFFADMALREEGFGELLPGVDVVVFDEAHQLPEVGTGFFGISVSASQLRELCRDVSAAYQVEAGDYPEVLDAISRLAMSVSEFRSHFQSKSGRVAWTDMSESTTVCDAVFGLELALRELGDALSVVSERGKALEACNRRCIGLIERLLRLRATETEKSVQWLELNKRGFVWHSSPLEISDLFAARVTAEECAWVFTSATLAIKESVEHFARRLGLTEYTSAIWDSPFDYRHQSLCYIPTGLPDPRDPEYVEQMLNASVPVLNATRGRAFLLFTSHAALARAHTFLKTRVDYPLFVQGTAPRDELLRQFRISHNPVLLGTSSFWEGVDVRGEALSCVIIDKLPFASPDDPLLQARLKAIRDQGKDSFMDYQLPQAVIALKQGAGRLIRDEGDCGVLMLCDSRLLEKSYGRIFLKSLPEMPITRSLNDVRAFTATI